MTEEEIVKHIISRKTDNVRAAACEIIRYGQDHEKIRPIIRYLPLIKERTTNLDMGGAFAPNRRFVDFAIRTLEFHQNNKNCFCGLYIEQYKIADSVIDREVQYDCFNPENEAKKGNINILEKKPMTEEWITTYIVECTNCKIKFTVEEENGWHFRVWNWKKRKSNNLKNKAKQLMQFKKSVKQT